eukprot:m.193849 g.193849  ORF g.193849 m.193849 type:complete len:93 (+) comp10607_c0_seq5:9265-9543(+)
MAYPLTRPFSIFRCSTAMPMELHRRSVAGLFSCQFCFCLGSCPGRLNETECDLAVFLVFFLVLNFLVVLLLVSFCFVFSEFAFCLLSLVGVH